MTSTTCDLCGLPLRYGTATLDASGKTYHFCCMGCRQVFTMLMDSVDAKDPAQFKETELFKKCVAMGIVPASEADLKGMTAAADGANAAAFSGNDGFQQAGRQQEKGTTVHPLPLNLDVGGMWCPACAWVIEETLNKQDGITRAVCNFSTDKIRCEYDPVSTSPDRVVDIVNHLGYRAVRAGEGDPSKDRKRAFTRFGISAFLTMNVMMLSFALYSGFFTRLSTDAVTKLSWPMFFMAACVIIYGGWHIMWKAWTGFVSGAPGMETLIAIGSVSAFLFSTYNMLIGSIHLYYDTASMLITLVLLGKVLERRAKDAIQGDLGIFFSLRPKKVRICTDEFPSGRYVSAEQLKKEDVFMVDTDEIVPADGVILHGTGRVDESAITGEPLPVLKKKGARLKSGTRIIEKSFKVRAKGVGDDSILGQMIAIMESSLGQKTPLEGRTDRILLWFVPVVAVLALGAAIVSLVVGNTTETAVIRAITVLVISCPCSLGIAIPLARVAGVALAGKKGILIRRFSAFEMAERIGCFVFDKTGTVTQGRWQLQEINPAPAFSKEQVLAMAAGLEKGSDHYIAVEIRRQAEIRGVKPVEPENIHGHENGIVGHMDGRVLKIGSRPFISREHRTADPHYGDNLPEDGTVVSSVFMQMDGRPLAEFTFGDRIKTGAHDVINTLKHKGYELSLVSGDGERATRCVAQSLGIKNASGRKLPQDKADYIQSLQSAGHRVAMVGDGINDAPALAKADLAVAIHSGYHLGREAADITLMRGDPRQVASYLDLAARVNKKIFQNFLYAMVYNVIAIPVAMTGLLTPLVAVCAMLMSSLSVIGNTLLLLRKT